MSGPKAAAYGCPGITTPQPPDAPDEGFVACYRAGHECPPKVALITKEESGRLTEYRCPCCGDFGMSFYEPREWLLPECRCGHPAMHHAEGGASCWTRADGSQTWNDDSACPCSWYEAPAEISGSRLCSEQPCPWYTAHGSGVCAGCRRAHANAGANS